MSVHLDGWVDLCRSEGDAVGGRSNRQGSPGVPHAHSRSRLQLHMEHGLGSAWPHCKCKVGAAGDSGCWAEGGRKWEALLSHLPSGHSGRAVLLMFTDVFPA